MANRMEFRLGSRYCTVERSLRFKFFPGRFADVGTWWAWLWWRGYVGPPGQVATETKLRRRDRRTGEYESRDD